MPTFTCKTPERLNDVSEYIKGVALPCTIHIEKGAKRSYEQEKTNRMWCLELEEQGDQRAEEYRAFNKLWFGVRLMKYQSEKWAEAYDRIVKPLDYDLKLALMAEPISYPLTSIMSTKTFTTYLDDVYHYWTGKALDDQKPLDEITLEHFNLIERVRKDQNPGTFLLTVPQKQ